MKRFLNVFLGTCVCLVCALPVHADAPVSEDITSFNSQITINQNTSLTILETINYFTPVDKHGIYRYIPVKFRRGNQIFSQTISAITVTDDNNTALKFFTYREKDNFVLKIGDPDHTFVGRKTYRLRYTIDDALTRFPDHDELYWDITGEGWLIPIEAVSASIDSPFAPPTKSICYSGPVGSTDTSHCLISFTSSIANLTYNQPLKYGDNVTVVIALQTPNALHFLTANEKLFKNLADNWALILLPFPLLILFVIWYRWGRDYEFLSPDVFDLDPTQPKRLKPLFAPARSTFVYEPLKNLTPAQAGALIDEKVDNRDIVADIIDLARKKYLKIDASESKGFFSSSTEYTFTRLKDADALLNESQSLLLDGLFATGSPATMSDLKGTFYTTMTEVKKSIDTTLTKEKLYVQNPAQSRGIGLTIAIIANTLVFLVASPSMTFLGAVWPYLLFAVQGCISLIFGYNLTQKSAIGTNLMLQAKSLQRTLDWGKWRETVQEKHLFIEEILPYAVALGVIGKLAHDMQDLGLEPPQYFQSMGFVGGNWSNMVSDFTVHAASQLSYNPSSSHWSSGSGFSGGFSGGGGGGGGGGSW